MNTLDSQAPLIVIGAGRSGSTLLMRMFQQHPDISFKGETSFLVPRLWRECFENRFWHNWSRYSRLEPTSAFEMLEPCSPSELAELQRHVGAAIAEFMCRLLDVKFTARRWGYKELWNGGQSFDFDWAVYDSVFPRATWVHLVRNPFSFARSVSRWNRRPLDLIYLEELLGEWVGMVRRSRQRAAGRYFELKLEDLLLRPQEALAPILDSVDLGWDPACEDALRTSTFVSAAPADPVLGSFKPNMDFFGARVEGLAALASELGYAPEPLDLQMRSAAPIDRTMTRL
jgi:hypothetical protein